MRLARWAETAEYVVRERDRSVDAQGFSRVSGFFTAS